MLHATRAGAALGRLHADHGESERAGLLRAVESDLDGLKGERTLWATPFVELVNAGLLVVYKQKDRAVQGLRAAARELKVWLLIGSAIVRSGHDGDDRAAKDQVVALAHAGGMRAWDAGPLANALVAEGLTAVLININIRYKSKGAGIRITNVNA